jgi:predicted NAD/FAD-dependent oxidoreductase
MQEVVIVGAGVAGLSLARALAASGVEALVLDRSRGVGGRAATRRVEGQPVDHGLAFFHGSHPEFLAALDSVEATRIEGWPLRVKGEGRPCQPQAFRKGERRLAFAEGVTAFPKSLARDLHLRLGARVLSIAERSSGVEVALEGGQSIAAKTLVLALPLEQTEKLLAPLASESEALRPIASLLSMMTTEPCLAVLAGYPLDGPEPDWDLLYPAGDSVSMLIAHDSAKRKEKKWRVLVYQCRSCFSRRHLEDQEEVWIPLVLSDASRLLGDWAGRPLWHEPHRWRYSRADAANTLAQPFWIPLENGASIGIGGEVFTPGGGVEGAFLSGLRLAARVLGEDGE